MSSFTNWYEQFTLFSRVHHFLTLSSRVGSLYRLDDLSVAKTDQPFDGLSNAYVHSGTDSLFFLFSCSNTLH
jgi:hypothetical protein